MKVGVVGASGFIGSAVADALEDGNHEVVSVGAPRLETASTTASSLADDVAASSSGRAFDALVRRLWGVEVVVNCAGMARPAAALSPALLGANALLPTVLREAARKVAADFVHVSSAAVQGRRQILDESRRLDPRTPYERSKALGEEALWLGASGGSHQCRVFRATSVQGTGRGMTVALCRYANLPVVPVVGDGAQPLPLSLLDNTASAIAFTATRMSGTTVVLGPWEGMTVRRLVDLCGTGSPVIRIPRRPLARVLDWAWSAGAPHPRLGANLKRLDLMVNGQRPRQGTLAAAGFVRPRSRDGYVILAEQWRRDIVADTDP